MNTWKNDDDNNDDDDRRRSMGSVSLFCESVSGELLKGTVREVSGYGAIRKIIPLQKPRGGEKPK